MDITKPTLDKTRIDNLRNELYAYEELASGEIDRARLLLDLVQNGSFAYVSAQSKRLFEGQKKNLAALKKFQSIIGWEDREQYGDLVEISIAYATEVLSKISFPEPKAKPRTKPRTKPANMQIVKTINSTQSFNTEAA